MIPVIRKEDLQAQIEQARAEGLAFLSTQIRANRYGLACLASDGSPCSFDGKGHIFSAFFLAAAAGQFLDLEKRSILISRIRSEEVEGTWAYMCNGPIDSDDTAFCLRALRLLGNEPEIKGLLSFRHPETGLFPTFKTESAGNLVFVLNPENNSGVHSDVAANVYSLLWEFGMPQYIDLRCVERSQAPEGYWRSYFYPSVYYSTMMYLSLLTQMKVLPRARRRGIMFLAETQEITGGWGDAYETALALAALRDVDGMETNQIAGQSALLKDQNSDGSWSTDKIIWRYPSTSSVMWNAYDTNRVIATSVALIALESGKHAI